MKTISPCVVLFIALIALVAVVSAGLPGTVTATIHYNGAGSNPIPGSYWDVNILSPTDNTELAPGHYLGWCGDSTKFIGDGTWTFTIHSSLTGTPAPLSSTIVYPTEWHAINHLLNHKLANTFDLQAAIWTYDGGISTWGTPAGSYSTMISSANADPDYVPGEGKVYAVVLKAMDPRTGKLLDKQDILIEVPVPQDPVPSPEFPTLALPVAMVLGLVFTVYTVKKREE